jgi:hypothetical protein
MEFTRRVGERATDADDVVGDVGPLQRERFLPPEPEPEC